MTKHKNEPTLDEAPKTQFCLARIRKGNGVLCMSLALPGKQRCDSHGGAVGSGAQPGNQNAVKHGCTTKAAKSLRKVMSLILKESKRLINLLTN